MVAPSRTPLVFGVILLLAFAIAAIDPYRSLLFAPILLGAPHALSDIWYLLVRDSGVPTRIRLALAIFSALILSTAAPLVLGVNVSPLIDSLLLTALLAIPLALTGSPTKTWPQWLIAGGLGFILLATTFPLRAVVAQFHNVLAIVFLFALALPTWGKRRITLAACGVLGILAIGTAVSVASGGLFLSEGSSKKWSPFLSLTFGTTAGVAGALLFGYAVLQLLHFSVWIGFIPALKGDLRWPRATRTLGFGIPILGGLILFVTIVAAPAAAVLDPLKTRQAYLTLVSFHGWMEIAWLLAHSARLVGAKDFSLRKTFLIEGIQHA